jgi:all-trans-retinol dehydrogenase (NAD+)
VHTYTVDCSKRTEIQRIAEQVKRDVGHVDILINNAGIVTGKKFLECPDALIEKTMEVNVNAHFWVRQQLLMLHVNQTLASLTACPTYFLVAALHI